MNLKLLLCCMAALPTLAAHAETSCALLPAPAASADDTALIQGSIDACAKQGGGTLRLPGKTFQIGPIQLRSKVYLWLAPDTVLQASRDKSRYVAAFIGWPYRANEALISGYQVSDSGILGAGRIDGQGDGWWEEARRQRKDGTMTRMYPDVPDANGMPRPWLVEFYDSSNITLEGPTLQNAPMWNLALRYTRKVSVAHLTVTNPKEAPNTDGIDIIASQDVDIQHVSISTGDDNVTIKSGLAGFDVPARPASNIRLSDAKLGDGHGVSIGSETLNGVDHVTLERLSFDGTSNGIRIKTGRDRGADIGFIQAKDIEMNNVGVALSVTAYYPNVPEVRDAAQPLSKTTPRIHDITIDHLVARGVQSAGRLIGLPESALRAVTLEHVSIQAQRGLTLRDADVAAHELDVQAAQGSAVQQQESVHLTQR